jgi:hypothetical protein
MGKINYGRVILGGIVGGIVAGTLDWLVNGVWLGQRWADNMTFLHHPDAFSAPAFLFYVYLIVIAGVILSVWMYAAIRPRFGAGVRTAVYAGLVTWALSILLPNVWLGYVTGIFGRRVTLYSTLGGLVEAVVGTIVGAWLYKEAESTPAGYPVAAEARQAMR